MEDISGLDQMAEGVDRLRGDLKKSMNIYFIKGPDGEGDDLEAAAARH